MTDMVIRSRGFNQGSDGAQITFVGILNDGEGLVLYRYEVPHAVAIKTGGGYCFKGSDDFGYLIEDKVSGKVLVGHIEDAEYLTGKKQRREVTKMLQAISSILNA